MSSNTEGLSKCCLSGKLHEGTPSGKEGKLGDLKAYITGDESNKSKTILFITDIFGYELNNARLLADEYAQAGFYVVVPDILEGDNIDHNLLNSIAPKPSAPEKSLTEKAADGVKVGAALPTWLARNREGVSKPKIEACVKALRADSQVGKIGAVGFCWGGRYAILLTHKDAETPVDAAVANHPSFLSVPKEIEPIVKPVLVNVGDADAMMPHDSDIVKTKEIFLKDLKDCHVNVYKGAGHGFTVRGDLDVGEERKQKDDAAEATIEWFKKYL